MDHDEATEEYKNLIEALGVTPRGPVSVIGGYQPNERQVLDLASGKGNIASGLAKTQTDVLATDINQTNLEYIDEYYSNLRIETEVVHGVSLEEYSACTFRAVTIAQAIYLERDWVDWLKNIVRILQPGGRLGHRWSLGKPGDFAYDMLLKTIELTKSVDGGPEEYYRGTMLKSEVDKTLLKLGMNPVDHVTADPSRDWKVQEFIDCMVEGNGVTWLIGLRSETKTMVSEALKDWVLDRNKSLEDTIQLNEDNSWDIWEKPAK